MKRTTLIAAALCLMTGASVAQEVVPGVSVRDFQLEHNGNYLTVEITIDLSNPKVGCNGVLLLTPCLINSDDSLHFESTSVQGKRRYFHELRNGRKAGASNENGTVYRTKELPLTRSYHEVIPYESWMNGADLRLHCSLYGCCEQLLAEECTHLGGYAEFVAPELIVPEFLYVTPEAEIKRHSLEGSAFVDFPVNQTTIAPDYHNNVAELGKIRETINSVRSDEDITIDNIWLKGYASPEGSYAHNRELAIDRVNAIKSYVQGLYNFPASTITTDYEPENWEGLRHYVEQSDLEHRAGIVALIDTDMELDAKETRIRTTYPADYRRLLQDCYPYLRRTDYRVNYTVRDYSDVEEIQEILRTQPQKLSLNEMYLVAQTFEPGSDEYVAVFETAVRLYPDDPVANLNAANAEMRQGEFAAAERHLAQAGDSPEAEYARGVFAYLNRDFVVAREHLIPASEAGLQEATLLLERVNEQLKLL